MNQHDFDLLLQKYLAGECSSDEEKQIQAWSEEMLESSSVSMLPSEKKLIDKRLWGRLSILARPRYNFYFSSARFGIAASILLILVIGAMAMWPGSTFEEKLAQIAPDAMDSTGLAGEIQVRNTSDKPYKMLLDDGTEVVLKPQSSLSYPEHFDEKVRIVHLSGEAFFNVTKNPARPFMVYTGDLVTRVLGTSFNIKSYNANKSVEVSVVTGRVSVYEKSKRSSQGRNGIILTPNQKIRFDSDVKVLVPELVEEPVVVHPPQTKARFIFDETPLPKVASLIQETYGIEIVLESNALEDCVFTGDINDLPLYSQLKFICKSINANYELRGTTLFMSGKGCHN